MPNYLNLKQRVNLDDGSYVVVVEKYPEGGQGVVYRVNDPVAKRDYALKWYIKPAIIQNDSFYNNLRNNINAGAPTRDFIWPLKLAPRQLGSYGYLMYLRPAGYEEFSHFFRPKLFPNAVFSCFQAKVRTALGIINGFHNLHLKGYSYKDINAGNFFINPKTGSVLICDNDNVTANNIEGDIAGMVRYMAAEVVNGAKPNINSDFFSLAIILYRVFMIDHPFEGKNTLRNCLTEEVQRKVYGSEMVFCFDQVNDINRPDRDNHKNSLYNWSLLPESLRKLFVRAFSREAILNPEKRVREDEWENALRRLRADLLFCPEGFRHDFLADGLTTHCPRCRGNGRLVPILPGSIPRIVYANHPKFAVTPNKWVFLGSSLTPVGLGVKINGAKGEEIGLRNITDSVWQLYTPTRRLLQIAPGDSFPLRDGMEIIFDGTTRVSVEMK